MAIRKNTATTIVGRTDRLSPRTSMKIGEVSQESGVGVEALRFYERSGLLGRPARSQSGYRLYDEAVLERLAFIRKAQFLGFSLDEIRHIISDAEKWVTAIHEAGHALLTVVLPHADPIHKVTIIPRGMALGLTQQLPVDEKHNYSREYLSDQIAILLGGRIAEEITLNSITTGAGNDLERSTEMARRMVCEWGMSDAMGPLTFGRKEEQIFLGREISKSQDYSEGTATSIDQEVKRLVMENYDRARTVLQHHKPALMKIADQLLAREVLDADQVMRDALNNLFNGEPVDPIDVIKWKDLYEHLEIATDKCEDVANIIESVLVKYT